MAGSSGNSIAQDRSKLKDFIGTVATMTGDLSNITAPPFVLDPLSTVQIPAFWAENTSVFCAPATSGDPAERALLALKTFLSGIRGQCYMGHTQKQGPKKPLNSFLGEVFLAKWDDENGITQMVGEQVSHHPPVTACRTWNDKRGIFTESFNRSSMTFSGSVHVESAGMVLLSIPKYKEYYLFPIPDFKITSVLSTPKPQLTGTCYIPSNNGYMAVVHFSEKSLFGKSSDQHSFEAHVFTEEDGEDKPIYTLKGSWYDSFTIRDVVKDQVIGQVSIEKDVLEKASRLIADPLEQQDSWESKKAWKGVIAALEQGDMQEVNNAKNALEEGQRQMRQDEEKEGKKWQPLFFNSTGPSETIELLANKIPENDVRKSIVQAESSWTLDFEKWKTTKKPYHAPLRPDNTISGETSSTVTNDQSQRRSEGQPLHQFDDGIDHKVGAVDDGRPAEVDGLMIDIGRSPEKKHIEGITKDQPGPQAAQTGTKEEYHGSGIEGMTLKEKYAVEDMLRDQYSTGNEERDYVRMKKKEQKD